MPLVIVNTIVSVMIIGYVKVYFTPTSMVPYILIVDLQIFAIILDAYFQ